MKNMRRETEKQTTTREQQPLQGVRFIGFDLDGTLLKEPARSHADIFGTKVEQLFGLEKENASNFAKSTLGIPTQEQLKSLHLFESVPTLRQLIADNIDTEFFNQSTELFPDVLPALDMLQQQGIHFFASSSRPTENIQKQLSDHPQLAKYIDFAIGTNPQDSTQIKGKRHFQKAADHFGISFEEFVTQSVFIGDTPSDILAGKSVGAKTVARAGTVLEESLQQAGADIIVRNFLILDKLIKRQI